MIGSRWTCTNKQRSRVCVYVCVSCVSVQVCVRSFRVAIRANVCSAFSLMPACICFMLMFSYLRVCPCVSVHISVLVCVCVFSVDRSHIQIRNMLTGHSGRSNCWSGGLRVWGGGQLIAGDYKPQSGGLVSGFDQTNTTPSAHTCARTHTTDVHKQACVSIQYIHTDFYYMLVLV